VTGTERTERQMKRNILVIAGLFFLTLSFGADLFVFSRDGTNVVSGARELPSVGVRLDTRQPVLGLYGAQEGERKACGWYRCVAETNRTPEGMTVAGRAWVIEGCEAVEKLRLAARPAAKGYEISKYKLLCELKALGALPTFVEFLNADQERKILFDAATALDSDNPLVTAAATVLMPAFGLAAAGSSNLLWRCRTHAR